MLAALVIAAMILTAVLSVYGRVQRAAQAVIEKVDRPALGDEVLQLIAKDLDRVIGAEGVTIEVRNGFDNGLSRAQLVIRQVFHDAQNAEQTLWQVVWQASYDYDSGTPGLVIYRSYEGVLPQDRLLDEKRELWEQNYPFIPICRGVTFFRIEVPVEDDFAEQWSGPSLPAGVKITLSFAAPSETGRGTFDVPDDQKVSRTIAIDRTRAIRLNTSDTEEPNNPTTANPATNDANTPRTIRR
jgi:hypothetical protein